MSQTSYTNQLATIFAGALSDSSRVADRRSCVNAEASASMPFGIMVFRGAARTNTFDPDNAILAVNSSSVPLGIVLHSHAYQNPTELTASGLAPKTVFDVLHKGRCWVTVEETVAAGDTPFVRYAAGGGGSQLGAFRKSADTATAMKIRGAWYVTAATTGNLAVVELDIAAYLAVLGVTGF